jgi:ABC-2 type transport system permease protein
VRKLYAVLRREYLMAVRKKMFIIMTFLLPFLMAGLITLPGLMVAKGMGEKRVAILDGTGVLRDAFAKPNARPKTDLLTGRRGTTVLPTDIKVDYVDRRGDANLMQSAKPYLDRISSQKTATRLDGVLLIPAAAFDGTNAKLTFYSRSATDLITRERLAGLTNKAIQRYRLAEHGISGDALDSLMRDVPVDGVQITKTGEQKKGGEANFFVGFAFAALLILPSFIYGLEIMRGIIQEKTDRIIEILVSSMSPMELLTGKILGIALVGLTQIGVWIGMALIVASFAATTASLAGINITQFLHPMTFLYFLIFFLLAYCTYVCVYAIGGAVCNSEKEAQQLIAPISMVMMAPWFLMAPIIFNPESPLAVAFSLAPVFGPITMFIRTLVSDPPLWHIAISILLSVATIALFFWVTAKIFRVGILSYGKRPTIPELWRWLKVA